MTRMLVMSRHGDVDHPACQQRADDLNSAFDTEQREGAVHQSVVRACINKQTTHQLSIVRLTEYVVFVRVGCGGSH